MANDLPAYHFKWTYENKRSVSLKHFKKGRRTIMGRVKEDYWFYGISSAAALYPFPHYKFTHHIFFKNDDLIYLDSDAQHQRRRSFAAGWFNRKWLETLFAFIKMLNGNEIKESIDFPVDSQKFLSVDVVPFELWSEHGYIEPTNE